MVKKTLFKTKKSAQEIANMFNITENSIFYWLNKHRIPTRSMKEIRKNKYWGLKGHNNPMWNKKGKLNPNWKGGITKERQRFYQSQEWKKACSAVWNRDNASCQRCGLKNNDNISFHIHHIVSFQNEELRDNINNLILLCESCHQWVHSKKNKDNKYIKENKNNE